MRKLACISIMLFLCCIEAFSQPDPPYIYFGIKLPYTDEYPYSYTDSSELFHRIVSSRYFSCIISTTYYTDNVDISNSRIDIDQKTGNIYLGLSHSKYLFKGKANLYIYIFLIPNYLMTSRDELAWKDFEKNKIKSFEPMIIQVSLQEIDEKAGNTYINLFPNSALNIFYSPGVYRIILKADKSMIELAPKDWSKHRIKNLNKFFKKMEYKQK